MTESRKPLARTKGIVTQEMPDELLVYDLETNKAHCLNSTAGFVWSRCDGSRTAEEIRLELEQKTGHNVSRELVFLALQQLNSTSLLENAGEVADTPISRREVIKKAGLAAVVALPLVSSLALPTSVMAAASRLPPGSPCTAPIECSSGVCIPGAPPFCA